MTSFDDLEVDLADVEASREGPEVERSRKKSAAWPDPLAPEAYHGLIGEIVRAIEPHTESDNAGLAIQLLIGFGSVIGRCSHFVAESDQHYSNLFAVLVGRTAKGRKGTSWGIIGKLLAAVDPDWFTNRVVSGASTGEGLIWHVRDPIETREPIRIKGKISEYHRHIGRRHF